MITEDYVSFEIAKLLKEKGLDEYTWTLYDRKGEVKDMFRPILDGLGDVWRPTIQMAMKWLREIHNLHIMVDCIGSENYLPTIQFTHSCKDVKFESKINKLGGNGFDTYEEACEEAIKYCLENLI